MSHAREDDTFPRLATPLGWCPPDELGRVIEHVVGVWRDHGNRSDRHRARLKYLLDERGEDWFRGRGRGPPRPPAGRRPRSRRPGRPPTSTSGGTARPTAAGSSACTSTAAGCATTAPGASAAPCAPSSTRFASEVRLTARQDVLLCGIEGRDRREVEAVLRAHGVPLAEELPPVQRLAVACPALPTCGQALAEAERVLPELVATVEAGLAAAGLERQEVQAPRDRLPERLRPALHGRDRHRRADQDLLRRLRRWLARPASGWPGAWPPT